MKARPACQKRRSSLSVRICEKCALFDKSDEVNCLPGIGPGRQVDIMIVGEKLSYGDIMAGEPFRGREGRKLNYLLERAGIKRDRVYTTHAVKCPAPKGKAIPKKSILACRSHLIEEIKWVRPKVIIPMGNAALKGLLKDPPGIMDARGFSIPLLTKTGKVFSRIVPTLSIDHAMASSGMDPIVIRDLRYALKISKGWTPPPVSYKVEVHATYESVFELCERLKAAPEWSFDLETSGFDFFNDDILCASFSFGDGIGHVAPIDHVLHLGGPPVWNASQREDVLDMLREAFASPAIKIAQNGKFDLKFLRTYRIPVKNFSFDTMLAHHLLDADKPHGLTFIAQWFDLIHERYEAAIDEQKAKYGEGSYRNFDPTVLYRYAGIDAVVTALVKPILEEKAEKVGVLPVLKKISMPQTAVLCDMEYRGVRIDRAGMDLKAMQTTARIEELRTALCEEIGDPNFNPGSLKQLGDYLAKKRIRLSKKTKGGGFSLDEEAMSDLIRRKVGGNVPSLILDFRGMVKLKGTYLDGKQGDEGLIGRLDQNNYLHTNYLIHGAYTGRLASKEPNLQNIPRENGIRQLFIPDEPGDVFMSVDYKQLEVRVAAAISRDPVLIAEIIDGVDMHSRNAASLLMKIPEERFLEIYRNEEHPDQAEYSKKRTSAKSGTFGILYGSTAHGISKRHDIPLEEAEIFIKRFFRKYRVLNQWIRGQHDMIRRKHRVLTPTGRFYHFYDLEWIFSEWCHSKDRKKRIEDVERISVNMPIQGYGSDIFQMRKIKLAHYLRKNRLKSRLVLTLHDGYLLNTKPDEREHLEEVVPEIMNLRLNEGTRYEVPVEVDIDFMPRWGDKA